MTTIKYLALVPIVGETGYGTYLLSSTAWAQDSTTPEMESTTPREIPNVDGPTSPTGEAVLEDAPVLPEEAKQQEEEETPTPPVEVKEEAKEPVSEQPKEALKAPAAKNVAETGDGNEMFNGAGEGSIGRKYQQYLLGTRKSSDWEGKVSTWRTEKDQNSEPFKFSEEAFEALKTQMTDRCEEAYKLESFNDTTAKEGQAFDKEKYWVMV